MIRNQLFEYKGCCSDGCLCHTIWCIDVENGEIIDYWLDSNPPEVPEEIDYAIDKDVVKENGKWYEIDEIFDSGEKHEIKVWQKDNHYYTMRSCSSLDESWSCLKYDLEKEAEKLSDGLYEVKVEFACYSTYCYEYGCYEGDGDSYYEITKIDIDGETEQNG